MTTNISKQGIFNNALEQDYISSKPSGGRGNQKIKMSVMKKNS